MKYPLRFRQIKRGRNEIIKLQFKRIKNKNGFIKLIFYKVNLKLLILIIVPNIRTYAELWLNPTFW